MNIESWAKRHLVTVDEQGATARVRLICVDNGAVLETWDGPFAGIDPVKWAEEAQTHIVELAEDWPPRSFTLMFVAEDSKGLQRSQCTKSVTGRNKEANAELMKNRDLKAVADTMESLAKTVDRTLATANGQLDRMAKHLETTTGAHIEALNYIRAKHENEAIKTQMAEEQTSKLMALANKWGPLVMDLLEHKLGASLKTSPVASTVVNGAAAIVRTAVADATTPPVTGATQ